MDLKQLHQLKCELLKVYRYQGLTLQELLCEFYSHINEVINSTNGLIDIVDYLVGDGLSQEVASHLNQMLIDGTFDKIINNKVDELSTNLNNQFNEMKKIIESNISESDKLIENLRIYDSRFNNIENKNIEQDSRLKNVENKNKVQDVYLSGLFNENKDGRLSIEGVGNDLKLEGSKAGLVEVDKVVGNTFVNLSKTTIGEFIFANSGSENGFNIYLERDLTQNKIHSLILNFKENTLDNNVKVQLHLTDGTKFYPESIPMGTLGGYIYTFSYTVGITKIYIYTNNTTIGKVSVDNIILLEGDYTNKPIPTHHIEGLQSSFEENLVTEEMVEQCLESAENLGKYKVPVRVVGKNLFDKSKATKDKAIAWLDGTPSPETNAFCSDFIRVDEGNSYVLSCNSQVFVYDKDKKCIGRYSANGYVIFTPATGGPLSSFEVPREHGIYYIRVGVRGALNYDINTYQIEEGTVATDYEDYFERTTNVYLNSPLLEGDEIVMKDGKLCHYHKCGNIVLDNTIDWTGRAKVGTSYAMQTNVTFNKTFDKTSNINGFCDKLPIDIYSYQTSSSCIDLRTIPNKIILKLSNLLTGLDDVLYSDKEVNSAFKTWLQSNPVIVTYKLAEPYYEPIQADKLLLECTNDSTIHLDTVVPVESISASYTGNVPSVYAIEETGITNTEDIAVTQMAVDFLLMSSMGESLMISFLNNVKGINNLGTYFASRIIKKALSYDDVINKYPQFKDDIDTILVDEAYEYLIK